MATREDVLEAIRRKTEASENREVATEKDVRNTISEKTGTMTYEQAVAEGLVEPMPRETAGQMARQQIQSMTDPSIVDRSTYWPRSWNEKGERVWAVPESILETLRIASIPKFAGEGYETSLQDVFDFAAAFTPSSVASGMAGKTVKPVAENLQEEIIQAGERFNVPVMTTDVAEPKGIAGQMARKTGEMIPFAGTTGPRIAQQEARERATKEFAGLFDPPNEKAIINSLKDKKDRIKNLAGNVLETTKNNMAQYGDVDVSNVLKEVDSQIARLMEPGRIKDNAAIGRLRKVKQNLEAGPQSFEMLRDNRTAIRDILNEVDGMGRSQVTSQAKAQFQKIYDEVTNSLDDFVQANEPKIYSRYKRADSIYADEATKLTKSRLKNVLDKGDITPEVVNNLIFSSKPSEAKLLFSSLGTEGRNNVRSALIHRAIEKAGGIEDINPTKFSNELERLQKNTDVFFRGKDRDMLNGMTKLLKYTKRAQEAAAAPPTGQAAIPILSAYVGSEVGFIPSILAMGSVGGMSRLYESASVRNMLVALGKTKENPASVNKILERYGPKIAEETAKIAARGAVVSREGITEDLSNE